MKPYLRLCPLVYCVGWLYYAGQKTADDFTR